MNARKIVRAKRGSKAKAGESKPCSKGTIHKYFYHKSSCIEGIEKTRKRGASEMDLDVVDGLDPVEDDKRLRIVPCNRQMGAKSITQRESQGMKTKPVGRKKTGNGLIGLKKSLGIRILEGKTDK